MPVDKPSVMLLCHRCLPNILPGPLCEVSLTTTRGMIMNDYHRLDLHSISESKQKQKTLILHNHVCGERSKNGQKTCVRVLLSGEVLPYLL